MTDTNVVVLVGRCTRDPELKYSHGGMAILELSIAVNARKKKGDEWQDYASFFDVTYFGKAAEAVSRYIEKGKQVAVSGKLEQQRWEKDGAKRSKVVVLADSVQLLGGKDGPQRTAPVSGGFDQDDGDIPF